MVTGNHNASLRRGGNISGQDKRERKREIVGWEPSEEDREFNHREVPTDGHVDCERAGGSSLSVCVCLVLVAQCEGGYDPNTVTFT